ncbi:hypothetical protein Tco_1014505 [Tanacetum coccineum]
MHPLEGRGEAEGCEDGGSVLRTRWWLGREMKVAVVFQRRLSHGDGDGDDGDKGDGMSDDDDGLVWYGRRLGWPEKSAGDGVAPDFFIERRGWRCLSGLRGLHYLLDKVVSVGTAPGPNSSDHNVNTITNGDGMPRMKTFRETILPVVSLRTNQLH